MMTDFVAIRALFLHHRGMKKDTGPTNIQTHLVNIIKMRYSVKSVDGAVTVSAVLINLFVQSEDGEVVKTAIWTNIFSNLFSYIQSFWCIRT